jgi:hypothetical protein
VFLENKFGFSVVHQAGSSVPALGVISIEIEDPANTIKEFATPNHPWATKFCEFAEKALV